MYFKDTLDSCGLYLLSCDEGEISYRLFEEFDSDSISFLHDDALKSLLDGGFIDKQIYDLSRLLYTKFRSLENTPLWNVACVKTSEKWAEVLKLSDDIKLLLRAE